MLTRFFAHNFKNLWRAEFQPAEVNLLIGRNNAGKTNLCQAMRFLSLTARHSLSEAAQMAVGDVWNLTHAYREEPLIEFLVDAVFGQEESRSSYHYRLLARVEREAVTSVQSLVVEQETLGVEEKGETWTLLQNQRGQAELLDESARPFGYLKAQIPAGYTALGKLFDQRAHPHSLLFKQYLHNWAYFNLNPLALRSTAVCAPFPVIRPHGENLGHFLHTLHNQHPNVEQKILAALREMEPKAQHLAFSVPDPEHVLWFLVDHEGKRFGVHHLSEGTLRYLVLCCIVIGLQEMPVFRPAPLVIIEEPENGLHVHLLKPLLARVQGSVSTGQFIFTTHNPYFVDLFDQHLNGLWVMKDSPDSTIISRPDSDRVQRLLENMPLGEIHFHDLLV